MLERVWRKGNPWVHCWWERKLVQPLWGTVWRLLKKLKVELQYDPTSSLLGIYPNVTKTQTWKDICIPTLTVALFTRARTWKKPKCPSVSEWIKKLWYLYTIEHYSAIKKWGNPTICNMMDLEGITLSEISQTEKDKYFMILLISGVLKKNS